MFFDDCTTLEELKKLYRKLAIQNHPDRGGSVEKMAQINTEFEKFLQKLGNAFNFSNADSDYTYDWTKDRFAEIIQKIIGFTNMTIEIIGTWIWCFDSFEYKDQLKELGFWFSGSKKAWVYSGMGKSRRRSHNSLDDLRDMHGSSIVQTKKVFCLN